MVSPSLLAMTLAGLIAQAPSTAPSPSAVSPGAPHSVRRLVYQFGFNTKVASQGTGTGTTTIDVLGPAKDGGIMVSGQDFWWNAPRPRATNTCEVYPNGGVSCSQRPYAISPIQLTIFSLLGSNYFKGLSGGHSSWQLKYPIKAAILPGGEGFAGNLYTWNCVVKLQGKGLAPDSHFNMVQANGTMNQQGGRYLAAKVQAGIAYDPVAKLPVYVSENRTHLPQTSVGNKDLVQLQLLKTSKVPGHASAPAAPAAAHS
jgi:hypothetical protein